MADSVVFEARAELAIVNLQLLDMETDSGRHSTKLLATRLLRVENRLPHHVRVDSLIGQVAALVFDGHMTTDDEVSLLRMAWASAVRAHAKAYGLRLITDTAATTTRAA